MGVESIFRNTGLYQLDFINSGRDFRLSFTNSFDGAEYGQITCIGLVRFVLDTHGNVDLEPNGELLPLFVNEVMLERKAHSIEIRIEEAISLTVECLDVEILVV